jgi:hypothetical protein
MHMVQLTPGQAGVFGGVMGAQGVQGAKVYASVYSGVSVGYPSRVPDGIRFAEEECCLRGRMVSWL